MTDYKYGDFIIASTGQCIERHVVFSKISIFYGASRIQFVSDHLNILEQQLYRVSSFSQILNKEN